MHDVIDLTTPRAIEAELQKLILEIGTPKASASIVLGHGVPSISLSSNWPSDASGDIGYGKGETFSEMFQDARRKLANWKVTRRETIIRKLAWAIIEAVDEHTHCTVTILRGKGFSEADIREFHEAACARAGEMCGRAPFVVEGV